MKPHSLPTDPDVDALLAGHALGDLDDGERLRLADLLARNPALTRRLQEFRTTLELLPLALPETAAPPQRLRRRVLKRSLPPPRPPVGRVGMAALGTVLGLVLLGLGLELHRIRQQLAQIQQHQAQIQQHQVRFAPTAEGRRLPLRATVAGLGASGEVMVTGNPTHNVLMLNDLPPPPPGRVYRLWATVDGHRVGCVSFSPTTQGHVGMLIPPMPTSIATSVSVSLEADGSGAAPRGPMVLSGSL